MSSVAECDELKELALDMTWETCERCQAVAPDVRLRECMTAYADPKENVRPLLCDLCAQEYFDYWDSLWKEYNSSRG